MRRDPGSSPQIAVLPVALAQRGTVRWRAGLMASGVALLGLLFLGLALTLHQAEGTATDIAITRGVQRLESPAMTAAMTAISALGYAPGSWLALGTIVTALLGAGLYRDVPFVLVGEVASLLVASIKPLVERPRPSGDSIQVIGHLLDYSYPSGHVVSYVGLYGFVFFLVYVRLRRSWLRTILLAALAVPIVLVGVSRVYLGHHWASDVLGGYALGSVLLWLLIGAYRLLILPPGREQPLLADAPQAVVSSREGAGTPVA